MKKKKATSSKKILLNKGQFYCKIKLPPISNFLSKETKTSPYQNFYLWLIEQLEPTNKGKLLKILFETDPTNPKSTKKDSSEIQPGQLVLDVNKVVLSKKDAEKLYKLWWLWLDSVTDYMSESSWKHRNRYLPSEQKLSSGYVYLKKNVFTFTT